MIFKALSRTTCEKFCQQKHSKKSIIISIKSSSDKKLPNVFCSDTNNVQAILSLSFDDIELHEAILLDRSSKRAYCMTYLDALKIRNFIQEWYSKVDIIIAHCDGGVSRSAGVIAAIMEVYENKGWVMWKRQTKSPNMTCFLRTLEAFEHKP